MFAWAGLDDAQHVLHWLEKSLDDRDPMTIMNLTQEPVLDFVRSDSRYQVLLRKIGNAVLSWFWLRMSPQLTEEQHQV